MSKETFSPNLRLKIIKIAHEHGLTIRFIKNRSLGGYYDGPNKRIMLNTLSESGDLLKANAIVSVFCHELAHHIQHTKGTKLSRKRRDCRRTVNKAWISNISLPFEYEADKIGSKLKTKLFPEVKGIYTRGYLFSQRNSNIRFLMNFYGISD